MSLLHTSVTATVLFLNSEHNRKHPIILHSTWIAVHGADEESERSRRIMSLRMTPSNPGINCHVFSFFVSPAMMLPVVLLRRCCSGAQLFINASTGWCVVYYDHHRSHMKLICVGKSRFAQEDTIEAGWQTAYAFRSHARSLYLLK